MPNGDSTASLIERLLSPEFTGPGAKRLPSEEYKVLQAGLLAGEKATGVSVSNLAGMPATELSALLGGEGEDVWSVLAESIRSAIAGQAASDSAALALQRELGLGQLALAQRTQEFTEQDVMTQRLLEAAGLATGPTGAIQLAHLARGQGAPQEEVAALFQNLPFVQELLHGQNVPGFGLPEQLGGEMRRVPTGGGTIQGQNLGVTIPGKKSITQQAFGTLSEFEQAFLGALGQSETGQSAGGFLEDIIKSFIPTRAAGPLAIS